MPNRSWKDFFRFGGKPRRRRYDWEGEVQGWLRDLIDSAVADGQARRELMGDWGVLTLREQQITALVCLGYTNPQIAGRLRLSVETVKTHVKNVLMKFRLHSKTELRLMFSSWDFSEWDR
jgi:DNA-binding CsgD family transcriptional regulator